MHCRRPSSASVQELLACAFGEVADRALGDAILEVGVYATKGKSLLCVLAGLFELVHPSSSASLMLLPTLFKQPIFAVCVVLRHHFMLACLVFTALVAAMRTLTQ